MGAWVNRVREWTTGRFQASSLATYVAGSVDDESGFGETVGGESTLRSADGFAGPLAMPAPVERTLLSDEALYALYFRSLCMDPVAGTAQPGGLKGEGPAATDWVRRLGACAHAGQQAADKLPRVPAVVPTLLKRLREERGSAGDLAQLIERDLVLVGELLREANSAYHGASQPVTRIADAVTLIGRRRLRMLLARSAFRPVFNGEGGFLVQRASGRLQAQFDMCAMACRLLAIHSRGDSVDESTHASEAILTALTECAGWMLMFRLLDSQPGSGPLPANTEFWRALRIHASALAGRIAQQWSFPDSVVQALAIQPVVQTPCSALKDLVARSDRLVKLRVLCDSGEWPLPSTEERATWSAAEGHCFDALGGTAAMH